jgi:GNAT superfamily N-acetyltransferase
MGIAVSLSRAHCPFRADGALMRIVALSATHVAAWKALFNAAASPCFCRYWHFAGAKNAWLERCAFSPEMNAAAQSELVARGEPLARGLIAVTEDMSVIGWMKLAPRATLPKLRGLSVYKNLDLGTDDEVHSVGCFLVHPAHRRNDVASALLSAADAFVLAWGGSVIEGYPRRSSEPLGDEEAWMGPEKLFSECGFVAQHDVAAYPVYRKRLAGLV